MTTVSCRTVRAALIGTFAVFAGVVSSPSRAQAPVSAAVAAANKSQLVDLVQKSHVTDIWPSKLVGTVNYKLSSAAWSTLLSKDGVNGQARLGRNLGEYIKAQGIGDLEKVETSDNNNRATTQGEVDELIGTAKTKIGLTVEATQPKLAAGQSRLLLNYISYVGSFLSRSGWTPRGGRANIKLVLSSNAKDIAVTVSKDATNFSIIAPVKEPIDWSGKMEKGLRRGGK